MDEPTLLRTRKAVNEGKIKLPDKNAGIPVTMAGLSRNYRWSRSCLGFANLPLHT